MATTGFTNERPRLEELIPNPARRFVRELIRENFQFDQNTRDNFVNPILYYAKLHNRSHEEVAGIIVSKTKEYSAQNNITDYQAIEISITWLKQECKAVAESRKK